MYNSIWSNVRKNVTACFMHNFICSNVRKNVTGLLMYNFILQNVRKNVTAHFMHNFICSNVRKNVTGQFMHNLNSWNMRTNVMFNADVEPTSVARSDQQVWQQTATLTHVQLHYRVCMCASWLCILLGIGFWIKCILVVSNTCFVCFKSMHKFKSWIHIMQKVALAALLLVILLRLLRYFEFQNVRR